VSRRRRPQRYIPAASGRLLEQVSGLPIGGASWVHRWWGDDFVHDYGDFPSRCPCVPLYKPRGDRRSMDEFMDDVGEDDEWEWRKGGS
jgi:hypothetical protein